MEKVADLSSLEVLSKENRQEILLSMLEQLEESFNKLDEGLKKSDWEKVEFYAHKIASSCTIVNANTTREIALNIELMLKNNNNNKMHDQINGLATEYKKLKTVLEDDLAT